jgi:rod shape-determining protein MreC
LLVSSGLGGVFPAGYPVARVTEVHRDAVQPLAQVRAAPLAHVDTDSEVMLVWFRADHPAAPVTPRPGTKPDAVGELSGGNAAMQPQVALHAAPVATPTPKPASPKATPPASPAPALPGQTP